MAEPVGGMMVGGMMDEKAVSYIVHESMMARQERTIKRLWILCIIIFLALIGTNAWWIYYESQFEEVVLTQDAETGLGGDIHMSGVGSGSIIYGESETDD